MSILHTRNKLRELDFDHQTHSLFNFESVRESTTPKVFASKSLDNHCSRSTFCAPFPQPMSKVCSITGSRATRGSIIHRRGMAKKKGGVGRHVTKNVPRIFGPNLHSHRIWVPELKKFIRIRVTARGLKTINKNGAYAALKKAGAI